MDYDLFDIDLEGFLFSGETVNETIAKLQSIQEKKELSIFYDGDENIFFENERRNHFRDRFRLLFRTISQNENIIKIQIVNCSDIRIPGSLIAEWILHQNKSVTTFSISFYHEQSDLDLLCDAIQRNNIIKRFIIAVKLPRTEAGLLGNAFRNSRVIEDVTFRFDHGSEDADIEFLKNMLATNSNIKNSCLWFHRQYTTIEIANAVGNIITKNNSLGSLTVSSGPENLTPILQGVLNSTRFGVITDFCLRLDFPLDFSSRTNNALEDLSLVFQTFKDMKNLKRLCFDVTDFDSLSISIIDANLKALHSLDCLIVNATTRKNDHVKTLVKNSSAWESKCKLHINIFFYDYSIDETTVILNSLDDSRLEKLVVVVGPEGFVEITKHIPKWKYLTDLKLKVCSTRGDANIVVEDAEHDQLKFAAAIFQNGSLENVLVVWGFINSDWHADAQAIIDEALSRNNLLTQSVRALASVPDWKWPVLLEMANATGIDFSFQIMPYLFSRFLACGKSDDSPVEDRGKKRKKDELIMKN